MKPGVAFFYGLRNLFGRKMGGERSRHRMLIPILSIALSLIPVIVILEVANGMIEGITLRFIEFDTGHLRLSLSDETEIDQAQKQLSKLLESKEVTAAHIEKQGGGLLFNKDKRYFVNIRAVPADIFSRDRGFNTYTKLISGSFDLSGKNSIVIGKALAEEFGITVGDSILIFTHQTLRGTPDSRFVARPNRFIVAGIYSIGYQDLDKSTVFISYPVGQRVLSPSNSSTHLVIKLPDPFTDLEKKALIIEKMLDPDLILWRILTWQEINGNYYNAFASTKVLLIFIMLLIVLVAAFNISSSMIMVVLDRVQEIGILKSIGASPPMITLSFMCAGFLAGLFSTVIGVSLGLSIAVNINELFVMIENLLTLIRNFGYAIVSPFIGTVSREPVKILNPEYYLETIPIRIDFMEVLVVSLLALFLSVFFSYFPARMAGRIRPLEVIRKH